MTILLQAADGGQRYMEILFWVAIIVIFYFFMIRPQAKRAKEAKKFRESLQEGTKVVTIGGIHGKVVSVQEKTVIIDTGSGKQRMEKSAISPDGGSNEQELVKK